jgi:hypothetical protein
MTDKTIKDRGLLTTTLPAALEFSFDKETRRQELIYYYQYALDNTLITVIGEQSRTALIQKTFADLGGSGASWQEAMRSWLQTVIPSAETNLYKLWLAYFVKYATTPDTKGVTYGGLSVEAAYRKFLTDFIGDGSSQAPFTFNFTNPVFVSDQAVFKQRKVFQDTATLSELVEFIVHSIRAFNDTATLSDAMVLTQKKFFADSFVITDSMVAALKKVFADTVTITDAFTRLVTFTRTFNDSATLSETVAYILRIAKADTVTISDSMLYTLAKVFGDTVTISDSVEFLQTLGFDIEEFVTLSDLMLAVLIKNIADTITISDSATFAIGGYNVGNYNEGNYNR